MKYLNIIVILALRSVKLLLFYIPMSPFFLMLLFVKNKHRTKASLFDKFMSLTIGEIWLFGKQRIDFRKVYEKQRRLFVREFTSLNLLFFLPGQWFTLSPLESALTILHSPIEKTTLQKIILIPYIYYLILFDESRHKIKANHGIGCALALSVIFQNIKKVRCYYYYRAIKILRTNSNYFFYDEGSTNYHIFVTSLFKNYFHLIKIDCFWFKGYETISHQLLNCNKFFYFGDDDESAWLFNLRASQNIHKNISIKDLIKDKKFKKSVIDRYFKLFTRSSVTLFLCVKGSDWGHSHYMVGSIMYFIEDKLCIGFKKNSSYTFNAKLRQKERLFSSNSPVLSNIESNLDLVFFKRLPKRLRAIKEYSENNYQIFISGYGWQRYIDFRKKKLKIIDVSEDEQFLKSSFWFYSNPYVDYSN